MAASKVFAYISTGTKFALGYMVAITSIRFVDGSGGAAGDECKIEDANGNVIYDVFSTGAYFTDSQRYEKQPMFNGLAVTTLTAGTVYVEID